MMKRLLNEFDTLINKKLNNIKSGKDEDLIKISHERFIKEQILNIRIDYKDKLSKDEYYYIKHNKKFLKKIYKLYYKNYFNEYIDIDLIKTLIQELK